MICERWEDWSRSRKVSASRWMRMSSKRFAFLPRKRTAPFRSISTFSLESISARAKPATRPKATCDSFRTIVLWLYKSFRFSKTGWQSADSVVTCHQSQTAQCERREESPVTNLCAMRMNMMCACDFSPCYLCCVAWQVPCHWSPLRKCAKWAFS